jgi:spermidine synthase
MKKNVLEITVFLSGAVVMMLELTGSRILAPFVGTSTFIWTSLIGVILASLSLGYYHGGMKADQDPTQKRLSNILFLAGIAIGIVAVINQGILMYLCTLITSVKWTAAISACVLFGVPAYLLGMVSPQAVRIRMKDLSTSGATIGRLYALSSLGSIVGTFVVGFYLMHLVGSRNILFILSVLTLLLSLINRTHKESVIAMVVFILAPFVQSYGKNNLLKVTDTEYCSVQVLTGKALDSTGKDWKIMKVGNEYSSGMYLDHSDSLVFLYSRFYKLMFHFHPKPLNTLLIGGGAYSVPKYFQRVYPSIKMDVVEIDPALTEIAENEFEFHPNQTTVPIHEDGRIFLNKNKKKYDVIMGDAYRSLFSIPFHLVTEEALGKMKESLTDDGILMINILSPVTGPNRDLLQSMVKTCQTLFPSVRVFKPMVNAPDGGVQNLMLVCSKKENGFEAGTQSAEIKEMLGQEIDLKKIEVAGGIVLTDDFAPVEHYAEKMLSNYFH